jgi:hypothetical protein
MKKALLVILMSCVSLATVLAQEQPLQSTPPPAQTQPSQAPPQQPPPSQPPPPQATQPPSPAAQPPKQGGLKDKIFYGGGVGVGFGDVDWVSISPVVGIRVIPRLHVGVGLTYRHTNDKRGIEDLTTSDLGGDVFAQFTLFRRIFAMAEYEYMTYEYFDANSDKVSSSFDSVYVGGGIAQPLGKHAAMIFTALYNLSYSSNEPSPYGSPWVYSAGVGVGF